MNRFVYLIGGGLMVVAVGIGVAIHPQPKSQEVALVNQDISYGRMNWQDNGLNQPRLVKVVQGHFVGSMTGIVKTDTDCAADSTGLSHCYNVIALTNHKQITVIYTHNMNRVKCLNPNQSVTLKAVNSHWAKIIVNSV